MGKIIVWILGKILDYWIGLIMAGIGCALMWFLYDPLSPWSGWRAHCIAICMALFIFCVYVAYKSVNGTRFSERNREKKIKETIESFDLGERNIINKFEQLQRNTIELIVDEPIVVGLISKGIIIPISNGESQLFNDGKFHRMCPVMLSSLAVKYLKKR
jgi:predicted PurR-regulated permease PerM